MTPKEALERFMKMNEEYYLKNTLKFIHMHSEEFFKFYPDITDVRDIKSDHVVDWLNHLDQDKGNSTNTRRGKVDSLHAFYSYLIDDDEIDVQVNPCLGVERPKFEENLTGYFDEITLIKLREASKPYVRDRAVFEALYAMGVRLTELANIKLSDINFKERIVDIKKRKGLKPRRVLFNYECLEWLNRYLATRNDDIPYLFVTKFGTQLNGANMYAICLKYKKKLKVDKLHAHMFRVTFATTLYLKGIPLEYIQHLLGHESLEDTLRYIRLVDESI